jgi:hypothetical protein
MRSRIYYLVNSETGENVAKYDFLSDCQREKKNRNNKAKSEKFTCKGGWILSKIQ